MRVFNEQIFSHGSQRPVGCIEKGVFTHVVRGPYPFPFQYPPKRFGNVQMRGVRGQVEKEKTSFLPGGPQFPYFMATVDGGIVKYHKGVPAYAEGECIEKAHNFVCGDALGGGEAVIPVIAVDHPEDVQPCGSLGRDAYPLPGQLPAVGDISFGTDVALIGIVKVNIPFTFLPFKFLQLLKFVIIELRRGDSPWAFPYTLISCANADKKRLKVDLLAAFPVAACQAALALPTLCLSCSIAARTASVSVQSMIGFRPRPARVCRPEMPSDWKRFTHAFTETRLIAVCSPALAEDRPAALRRTARQRIRKQWRGPLRNPVSSCISWTSVNVSCFIFPIANCSYNNITQRKSKHFI